MGIESGTLHCWCGQTIAVKPTGEDSCAYRHGEGEAVLILPRSAIDSWIEGGRATMHPLWQWVTQVHYHETPALREAIAALGV